MWQTVGTIVANTGTLPFTQIIGTLNALAIDYSDRPNKTFYLYSDLVEYRPDANRTRPVVTFFRMTEEARTKYQASEADRIPNLSGSTVYVFGFGARQSGLAAGDEEYPALRAFWEWWFRQAGASVDLRTPADAF